MNNTSLPLISLSGAETARALSQNLSQTSECDASSIKRANSTDFSFYLGGPLQRPDPLRFHIFVPTPVIWLRSAKNTPHVSHYSSCAIYLDFSAFAPSLSSLLMRSDFFFFLENYDVIPRSRLQMKCTFWSWVNTQKNEEDVKGAKIKPCINSTLPHINKFPRLLHERHKSTDVRKMIVFADLSYPNTVGLLPLLCAPIETHGCSAFPNDWLTMLTVRFRLGTDPMPQSLFPPSSFSGHLKVVLV